MGNNTAQLDPHFYEAELSYVGFSSILRDIYSFQKAHVAVSTACYKGSKYHAHS